MGARVGTMPLPDAGDRGPEVGESEDGRRVGIGVAVTGFFVGGETGDMVMLFRTKGEHESSSYTFHPRSVPIETLPTVTV
jgi:hypothetical protein